jgi:hypothetical protein
LPAFTRARSLASRRNRLSSTSRIIIFKKSTLTSGARVKSSNADFSMLAVVKVPFCGAFSTKSGGPTLFLVSIAEACRSARNRGKQRALHTEWCLKVQRFQIRKSCRTGRSQPIARGTVAKASVVAKAKFPNVLQCNQ